MVTVFLILSTIVAIVAIVRSWRQSPFIDDTGTVPLTAAAREYQWRQRMDAAVGTESEERLELHARGSKAKRRLLAELRNREGRKAQEAGIPVTVKRPLRLAR